MSYHIVSYRKQTVGDGSSSGRGSGSKIVKFFFSLLSFGRDIYATHIYATFSFPLFLFFKRERE